MISNQELSTMIEIREDIKILAMCIKSMIDSQYESTGLAFNEESKDIYSIINKSNRYLSQFKGNPMSRER